MTLRDGPLVDILKTAEQNLSPIAAAHLDLFIYLLHKAFYFH